MAFLSQKKIIVSGNLKRFFLFDP